MEQKIPYWTIRDTVAHMLDVAINSAIQTECIKTGTVHKFMGRVIGYNLSEKEIIEYKDAMIKPLNDAWCEIGIYESCLLNLSHDNYENIRNIFREIRRNIKKAQ